MTAVIAPALLIDTVPPIPEAPMPTALAKALPPTALALATTVPLLTATSEVPTLLP